MRILSLLPSITEIISALGLDPFLVGVTHQCDFPPEVVSRAPVITTCAIDPSKLTQAEINEQVAGSIARGQSLYGLKEKELKELQPTIIFTQARYDVCTLRCSMPAALLSKATVTPPRTSQFSQTYQWATTLPSKLAAPL